MHQAWQLRPSDWYASLILNRNDPNEVAKGCLVVKFTLAEVRQGQVFVLNFQKVLNCELLKLVNAMISHQA